jgi:hypothetical protein
MGKLYVKKLHLSAPDKNDWWIDRRFHRILASSKFFEKNFRMTMPSHDP